MTTKIKVVRTYTFKAYAVESSVELSREAHSGEFVYKSDCHYYVEKEVLDTIQANRKNARFAIYQVSTQEDSKQADKLIEVIEYNGEKINITY